MEPSDLDMLHDGLALTTAHLFFCFPYPMRTEAKMGWGEGGDQS